MCGGFRHWYAATSSQPRDRNSSRLSRGESSTGPGATWGGGAGVDLPGERDVAAGEEVGDVRVGRVGRAERRLSDLSRVEVDEFLKVQDPAQAVVAVDQGDIFPGPKPFGGRPVNWPAEREQDREAPRKPVRKAARVDDARQGRGVHEPLERGVGTDRDLLEVVELVDRGLDLRKSRKLGLSTAPFGVGEPPLYEAATVRLGDHVVPPVVLNPGSRTRGANVRSTAPHPPAGARGGPREGRGATGSRSELPSGGLARARGVRRSLRPCPGQ